MEWMRIPLKGNVITYRKMWVTSAIFRIFAPFHFLGIFLLLVFLSLSLCGFFLCRRTLAFHTIGVTRVGQDMVLWNVIVESDYDFGKLQSIKHILCVHS